MFEFYMVFVTYIWVLQISIFDLFWLLRVSNFETVTDLMLLMLSDLAITTSMCMSSSVSCPISCTALLLIL